MPYRVSQKSFGSVTFAGPSNLAVMTMYLDLLDILRAPGTSIERAIDLKPVALGDVEFVQPITGRVRAVNARRNIVVTGRAQSSVKMPCARCLRDYEQPVDLELEADAPLAFFRVQTNSVVTHGRPKNGRDSDEVEDEEDEIDDETAAIFDAHSVDVLELLRQSAVLNWPIQPLCSPDCPGIVEHQSNADDTDARWAGLQDWAQKNNER